MCLMSVFFGSLGGVVITQLSGCSSRCSPTTGGADESPVVCRCKRPGVKEQALRSIVTCSWSASTED